MILYEPTSGLDVSVQASVLKLREVDGLPRRVSAKVYPIRDIDCVGACT